MGERAMIAGFEHRWQIEAQLRAFEHERNGAQNERHLDAIAAQKKLFEAERDRMLALEAERIEREHQARLAAAQVGARIK